METFLLSAFESSITHSLSQAVSMVSGTGVVKIPLTHLSGPTDVAQVSSSASREVTSTRSRRARSACYVPRSMTRSRANVQYRTTGLCAGARRLRSLSVTGFPSASVLGWQSSRLSTDHPSMWQVSRHACDAPPCPRHYAAKRRPTSARMTISIEAIAGRATGRNASSGNPLNATSSTTSYSYLF